MAEVIGDVGLSGDVVMQPTKVDAAPQVAPWPETPRCKRSASDRFEMMKASTSKQSPPLLVPEAVEEGLPRKQPSEPQVLLPITMSESRSSSPPRPVVAAAVPSKPIAAMDEPRGIETMMSDTGKDAGGESTLAMEAVSGPGRKRRYRKAVAPMDERGTRRRLVNKTPTEFACEAGQSRTSGEGGYLGAAIADRVLRTTRTLTRARQLLDWFRARAEDGAARICGALAAPEDVEVASLRVEEVWMAKRTRRRRPTLNNYELIMKRVAQRSDDLRSAGEIIDRFGLEVGRVSSTGRAFSEAEIAAARAHYPKLIERILPCSQQAAAEHRDEGELNAAMRQGQFCSSDLLCEDSGSDTDPGNEGGDGARECDVFTDDVDTGVPEEAGCPDDNNDDDDVVTESDSDLSSEEEVDVEDTTEHVPAEDLIAEQPPALGESCYSVDWSEAPMQGMPGFNDFATSVMRKAGVAIAPLRETFDTSVSCPALQPHQEATVFLLHPQSPVSRLLVDHPTGSGKTREMIDALNSYFHDPRPKVPIFPKEVVCRNFYSELLRWPSRYRDYFCLLRPGSAACAAGARDWRSRRGNLWDLSCFSEEELRAVCKDMREVLEMKDCFFMGLMRRAWFDGFHSKYPGEALPAAPLRALRYTSAGGRHTIIGESGWPASCLLKIGFNRDDGNVYSNKIVFMDEVHNLVRTQTKYGEQLARLRELLVDATGTVLAGFTGTPILSEPQEGRQLLDLIKGTSAPSGDEGFLSSFPMRPQPLFARSLPAGIPDGVLDFKLRQAVVRKVLLQGEALQRYDGKRAKGHSDRRLKAYCNMSVYFGSFHTGKSGTRKRVMEDFEGCAPKLHTIAQDVALEASKVVVLINRSSGMDALIEHLRRVSVQTSAPFGVATMEQLADFNSASNLRGERYRVLVADASQCSEGVSFFAVRRMFLADVPATPSGLVQAVGRGIRMYGHRGLSEEEQTVTTTIYVAGFPKWLRSPLSWWTYRMQKKSPDPRESEAKAKRLLRALVRVGIRDLDGLKVRLEAYCQKHGLPQGRAESGASNNGEHQNLRASSAIGFLQSIGLWQYARTIEEGERKNSFQRHRQSAGPSASRSRTVDAQQQGLAETKLVSKHFLVRALDLLHAAVTTTFLVDQLGLGHLTADEVSLHALAARSRDFVPALNEFRDKAVDRAILGSADMGMPTDGDSDSAESVYEFEVSSGSGGDDDAGPKEAPLVLPPAWRMQRMLRAGREVRAFISPRGVYYWGEAQAREAVAKERRAANLAQQLRSRFAQKLGMAADHVGGDAD